jgi:hypothetical protein
MADAYAQHEANKAAMSGIDQGLDALIAQTGQIHTGAKAIGQELSEQIQIVQDTNERMDGTDARINQATDKVHAVGEAVGGSAIFSWICMILLIVLIIVVVVLPKSIFGG